jgi:hypothetical protein
MASLTAAASAAEIAYTKSTTNLREGPGTSYDIVKSLPKNTMVSVEACTSTWCAVTTEDDDEGFVSKALLKKNKGGPDIPFSIQIIIGPEGPFIEFGDIFGPGPKPSPPPPPPEDDAEVCFYREANFKGAAFCVDPGTFIGDIPGSFDNNIESFVITVDIGVEVCTGFNMGGSCVYYVNSRKTLPTSLRNKITSFQVDDVE